MSERTLIALIIELRSWGSRQVIDGVTAYSREHAPWQFVLQEVIDDGAIDKWLLRAKPAGVIAEVTSRAMSKALQRMSVPVVDILGEHPTPQIPQVVCDDREVARQAVDHLFDRGLRHIAFVGERGRQSAEERGKACEEHVLRPGGRARGSEKAAQVSFVAALFPGASLLPDGLAGLAAWLRGLPKPVGVVACDDMWAAQILRACGDYSLHVPDDIAVIGADDDPVFCQMSDPLLSSIDCNAHAIGYQAAAMLHGMVSRAETPPPVTVVPPGTVRSRGSTDVLAIADQDVVTAVRLLREHACTGLGPDDIAARLGVSRRTLERMFDRHVGHSPANEMNRVRLERARELLAATALPLAAIATRVGIANVETMHRLFKRRFGVTPGGYRRLNSDSSPRSQESAKGRRR